MYICILINIVIHHAGGDPAERPRPEVYDILQYDVLYYNML